MGSRGKALVALKECEIIGVLIAQDGVNADNVCRGETLAGGFPLIKSNLLLTIGVSPQTPC